MTTVSDFFAKAREWSAENGDTFSTIDAQLEYDFGYWCKLSGTLPSSVEGKEVYARMKARRAAPP